MSQQGDLQPLNDYLDALDARSAFMQRYWFQAGGIYTDLQPCEDHFDDLIRAGAFRVSWIRKMAEAWRQSEHLETVTVANEKAEA